MSHVYVRSKLETCDRYQLQTELVREFNVQLLQFRVAVEYVECFLCKNIDYVYTTRNYRISTVD